MKVAERTKRRTAISTVPKWKPSAEGYALAQAHLMATTRDRPMYYRLLPDHSVQPILGETAHLEFAYALEKTTKPLLATDIDGWRVSTIFLGFDHSFMDDGLPELFETIVFTSATATREIFGRKRAYHEAVEQQHYATYAQAMEGHAECVSRTRMIVWGINKLKGPARDE